MIAGRDLDTYYLGLRGEVGDVGPSITSEGDPFGTGVLLQDGSGWRSFGG